MERLAIEHISVFALPPVEFVHLAADLGCHYIGAATRPIDFNPHNYPDYALDLDPALRRDMIAAMRERDVSISVAEGLMIWPGQNARDLQGDLDVMHELGAARINTLSIDPDLSRSLDQFGILAEMAAEAGMETTLEFLPGICVCDLPTAVAAVRHVGRKDFRLMIDAMHLFRTGSTVADVAALDPDMIGYIQLCDVPLVPVIDNYGDEAKLERMVPGTGELPLVELLAALPRDRIVGLEVPLRSQAEAGIGPRERLAPAVEAARRMLAEIGD